MKVKWPSQDELCIASQGRASSHCFLPSLPKRVDSAGRDGTGTAILNQYARWSLRNTPAIQMNLQDYHLKYLPNKEPRDSGNQALPGQPNPYSLRLCRSVAQNKKPCTQKRKPTQTSYLIPIYFKTASFKEHHFLLWHYRLFLFITSINRLLTVENADWLDLSKNIQPIS